MQICRNGKKIIVLLPEFDQQASRLVNSCWTYWSQWSDQLRSRCVQRARLGWSAGLFSKVKIIQQRVPLSIVNNFGWMKSMVNYKICWSQPFIGLLNCQNYHFTASKTISRLYLESWNLIIHFIVFYLVDGVGLDDENGQIGLIALIPGLPAPARSLHSCCLACIGSRIGVALIFLANLSIFSPCCPFGWESDARDLDKPETRSQCHEQNLE